MDSGVCVVIVFWCASPSPQESVSIFIQEATSQKAQSYFRNVILFRSFRPRFHSSSMYRNFYVHLCFACVLSGRFSADRSSWVSGYWIFLCSSLLIGCFVSVVAQPVHRLCHAENLSLSALLRLALEAHTQTSRKQSSACWERVFLCFVLGKLTPGVIMMPDFNRCKWMTIITHPAAELSEQLVFAFETCLEHGRP